VETNKLISVLAETAGAVRPLARPWRRTVAWLMIAVLYTALVVLVVSPRPDLATRLLEPRFAIEEVAALATGISAAVAAFTTIIPGYDRRTLLLPIIPAFIWLGSLGEGCVEQWVRNNLSLQLDWFCFPAIVLIGAIPAIFMVAMLRRGAPLTPYLTATLGGLATAGLGNFGLRLFHAEDGSLMVLVWQMGTVLVLTALAGSAGPLLLDWQLLIEGIRREVTIGLGISAAPSSY
jgi:hypothetical protein